MPVLDITTYKIDFSILDDNNPDTLIILDKSTYLDTPEKPLLDITLPGYTGFIEVPYKPSTISLYNSDSLTLTEPCEDGSLSALPDGVYQITMKICPYDEFYATKCYLKTSSFNAAYEELLITFTDSTETCYDHKLLREEIIDIDILIQSAKAEANLSNIEKASEKYRTAVKKLASVNKKINCN